MMKGGKSMQDILYIILLSSASVVALFLLTKIMGYRQMSELSMFDYINGITIGSIAAEMATALEDGIMKPLTAMIVYTFFSVVLSYISSKSLKARRFIGGHPTLLINNGVIYEKNLKKTKIDLSELLVQCRVSGYFDISKIQIAVLEDNGKISFLPKSEERPITPNDLGMKPKPEYMVANLIIDGKLMENNLKHSGKDLKWLNSQLDVKKVKNIQEVLLATCDLENKVTVYRKNEIEHKGESDIIG